MTFTERVNELRKQRDLSLQDLSDKTGFSRSYLGMVLQGRRAEDAPSEGLLEALDKVFPGLQSEYTCPCCGRLSAEPLGRE